MLLQPILIWAGVLYCRVLFTFQHLVSFTCFFNSYMCEEHRKRKLDGVLVMIVA